MCTGYPICEGVKTFRAVVKKYSAPATTKGNGKIEGNITSLPGQKKVPNPTRPEIAPDAPIPILSGE